MFAACATCSMRIRETFGYSATDSRIRALRLAFGRRGTGTMHTHAYGQYLLVGYV